MLDVSDAPGDTSAIAERIRELTDGRGTDSAIDAVGMEAHGAPFGELAQKAAGYLPDAVAKAMIEKAGIDRLSALYACFESVRRGGTVSISGVYGGAIDPMPMMQLFDKGIQIRMGQAHVKRWIDEILPLVTDEDDPLGTEEFATHRLPLSEAPARLRDSSSRSRTACSRSSSSPERARRAGKNGLLTPPEPLVRIPAAIRLAR